MHNSLKINEDTINQRERRLGFSYKTVYNDS